VAQRFFAGVGPDIGASLDERDLGAHIWKVVRDLGREWFQIDIPPADVTRSISLRSMSSSMLTTSGMSKAATSNLTSMTSLTWRIAQQRPTVRGIIASDVR